MKTLKRMLLIILTISFLSVPAMADEWMWCQQSTATGNSAVIDTGPGLFFGMMITTDGTTPPTVNLYDNATTSSGVELFPAWTVTTSSTDRVQTLSFNSPIRYRNGLYTKIAIGGGGTTSYMLYFRK